VSAAPISLAQQRLAMRFSVAIGGDAFDALRQWPSLTAGVMNLRIYDYLVHHRRGVGRDAASTFPGGRRAQKMVFAFYRRYGRSPDPTNPITRVGTGRLDAADKMDAALGEGTFRNLEEGARVSARRPMLIPFPGALRAAAARMGADQTGIRGLTPADRAALAERRDLVIIKRPGGVLLIGRRIGISKKNVEGRSIKLLAIVTRNRTQRPLLGFFRRAESILPYHLGKIEKSLAAVATHAGRVRVARGIAAAGVFQHEDTFLRNRSRFDVLDQTDREALTKRGEQLAAAAASPEPERGAA
jgi:hypothetical protein